MARAPPLAHQLAAVMFTDIVGYTAAMAESEARGIRLRKRHCKIVQSQVELYGGRWIEEVGDESLTTFPSAVDAVNCALAIQDTLLGDAELKLRIGIHSCDVLIENGRLYGDGVNIASRIRPLAQPGGICISEDVKHSVENQPNITTRPMGPRRLKNVPRAMPIFALIGTTALPPLHARKPFFGRRTSRLGAVARDAMSSMMRRSTLAVSDAPKQTPEIEAPQKPAIVVLPFENLTGDPEQEYFSDGLTEDVTTALSKFPNLLVIASNSAFSFKGKRAKPQDVGCELGVQYLLEGSVQRAGDRRRINAQLIETVTGHHVWAQRFEAPLEGPFAIWDEIIEKIVLALAFKITNIEVQTVAHTDPVAMNAYEAYLQGVHQFSFETEEALQRCRERFERATLLDPQLARAWGYLAYCDVRAVQCGWKKDDALEGAEVYARRAVSLDSYDHANHWDLAFVHLQLGRFDQALSEYNRALVLNPNDSDLLVEMADMLVNMGEPKRAISQVEHAMVINPYYPDWYLWTLGWAHYHAKDYEKALESLNQISDSRNDIRLLLAATHAQKGDAEEAETVMRSFLAEKGSHFTTQDVKQAGCIKRQEDENHWVEGLRKAGLPDN